MGNCQAIDAATLLIQHPNGKEERLYWPVSASEIMRTNPGHYVALILALCLSEEEKREGNPVRFTRVKLLRPTDTLVLGQAYRLISSQEVMKVIKAKKYAKTKNNQPESTDRLQRPKEKLGSDVEADSRKSHSEKPDQATKNERHRPRTTSTNSAAVRSKTWRPSLQSISEAAS